MIDNDVKLAELTGRIASAPWVALDTEADSLHAYPEKICLVQVTTPVGDELIDPLSAISLQPLFTELAKHELIMHGSDYDLRLFRKHHDFVPSAIFDTMLASRLLGLTQFGLTHLVVQYLGVTLDKGPQKADWAQRPLTERMENYARHDTHYLKPLSDILKGELAAKGRTSWQQESCARLIEDCAQLRPADPDLVWRLKGSHKLPPPALAVLRELWNWREAEATAANKPPYFILRHEALIDIALAAVENRPVAPLVPPKFSDRRRQSLAAAIQTGLAVPSARQPRPLQHTSRRLTDADKHRLEAIQKRRDSHAAELGIDPTIIASRATMIDLADDWDLHQKDLMNWQRDLLKQN